MAMHDVDRVVDVEHDRLGGRGVTHAIEVDNHPAEPDEVASPRRVLAARHGRLAHQVRTALRQPPAGELEGGVGAQAVEIVGVFVAAGDGEDAREQNLGQRVNHPRRITRIGNHGRELLGDSHPSRSLCKQHHAAVRRQAPTVEPGGELLAPDGWKPERQNRIVGHGAARGVPLWREGTVIGVIFVGKVVAQAFTATQIDLVTNFADQAVIAIENVRLFEEVQARTAVLQESLEYQTATGEVLNVISRSPSEIKPVLETITETAGRLCDAYDVLIRLREGHLLKVAAHRGPIAVDSEPMAMGRGWAMGRAAVDRKPVHVHDLWAAAHEFPMDTHWRGGSALERC